MCETYPAIAWYRVASEALDQYYLAGHRPTGDDQSGYSVYDVTCPPLAPRS